MKRKPRLVIAVSNKSPIPLVDVVDIYNLDGCGYTLELVPCVTPTITMKDMTVIEFEILSVQNYDDGVIVNTEYISIDELFEPSLIESIDIEVPMKNLQAIADTSIVPTQRNKLRFSYEAQVPYCTIGGLNVTEKASFV